MREYSYKTCPMCKEVGIENSIIYRGLNNYQCLNCGQVWGNEIKMKSPTEIIRHWCKGHSYSSEDNLFVKRLKKVLSEKQIAKILIIVGNTCHHCWDNDSECQCRNDG